MMDNFNNRTRFVKATPVTKIFYVDFKAKQVVNTKTVHNPAGFVLKKGGKK